MEHYVGLDVSLVGQNLLQDHHREFPGGTEIVRGVYGRVTWQFADTPWRRWGDSQ